MLTPFKKLLTRLGKVSWISILITMSRRLNSQLTSPKANKATSIRVGLRGQESNHNKWVKVQKKRPRSEASTVWGSLTKNRGFLRNRWQTLRRLEISTLNSAPILSIYGLLRSTTRWIMLSKHSRQLPYVSRRLKQRICIWFTCSKASAMISWDNLSRQLINTSPRCQWAKSRMTQLEATCFSDSGGQKSGPRKMSKRVFNVWSNHHSSSRTMSRFCLSSLELSFKNCQIRQTTTRKC